jgi:hypothetical protein
MREPTMRLLLVCTFLAIPSVAGAQSASLAGTVRDSSGSVLPGVTVEAASDALIERTRTTITDGTGHGDTGSADIHSLANNPADTPTVYDGSYDPPPAERGGQWLNPTTIVHPRFARVNLTFNF